jgi:antitoxin (DNA-binding transcriptional repressor) of toxin-antitoxin stability system
MTTVTLQEAQAHLAELIARLRPNEPVVITEGDHPVACLSPVAPAKESQYGSCRGLLTIIEDGDPLVDFADCMP